MTAEAVVVYLSGFALGFVLATARERGRAAERMATFIASLPPGTFPPGSKVVIP